jgi:hypothetical protein
MSPDAIHPRRSALALTLAVLTALAALAPPVVFAQAEASVEPVAPKVAPCEPPDAFLVATCLATATPIEADDSLLDPQAVPYDHVTVGPDGRTLTVYFWMGAQPCSGLYGVETQPVQGGIDLTVLVGAPEDAATMTCIAIAQLYATVVTLDAPLVVSGSGSEPAATPSS